MTDIVERLRKVSGWTDTADDLCHEAAAEIERLRAQVDDLTRIAGAVSEGQSFDDIKRETQEVRQKGLALLGLADPHDHPAHDG